MVNFFFQVHDVVKIAFVVAVKGRCEGYLGRSFSAPVVLQDIFARRVLCPVNVAVGKIFFRVICRSDVARAFVGGILRGGICVDN